MRGHANPSAFIPSPWPQSPTKAQVRAVAKAAREVRRLRDEILPTMTGGLRALYRSLELPGKHPLKDAHAALDAAVMAAYGFKTGPKHRDLLAQLLGLNHKVAKAITQGEPVTPQHRPAQDSQVGGTITRVVARVCTLCLPFASFVFSRSHSFSFSAPPRVLRPSVLALCVHR